METVGAVVLRPGRNQIERGKMRLLTRMISWDSSRAKVKNVSNRYILRDEAMRKNDIYSLLLGCAGEPADAGVEGVSAMEIEEVLFLSTSSTWLTGFRVP